MISSVPPRHLHSIPTRRSSDLAGIRDRVEADQYVQSWLYKRPETTTVLLRPAHITGSHASSLFMEYVNAKAVPMLLRSEEHTSELQSLTNLVCRLLLEKKKDRL